MTDPNKSRLSELFVSHYQDVLAYCARRIGRNEAEDVVAEVFAVASRRADQIDWTTARPWLYGIARGVLANRWRTLRRRQRTIGLVGGLAAMPIDSPDELILRRAEDGEAISALRRLRSPDREVLMLAAWEDMSGAQIASALGISLAAAEQRLHRAKQRFAAALEPKALRAHLVVPEEKSR